MTLINKNGRIPYETPKKEPEWEIDEYTWYLLRLKIQDDPTFKRCFGPTYNITNMFHNRLHQKIHGNIKGHFIIAIRGLQGVDVGTGQMKTSLAIELLRLYDTHPTTDHIGFSNDELLEKAKTHINQRGKREHLVLIRDETPGSLKRRSTVELDTLIDSIRQAQCSFILIRPEMENLHACTFILEPMYHAKDLTWLKTAIYVQERGYIGYLIIRIHLFNPTWQAYQPYKESYINKVIERQVNKLEHKQLAQQFIASPQFKNCIVKGKFHKPRTRKYITDTYPNITNQERTFIFDSVTEIIENMTQQDITNLIQPDTNTIPEPQPDPPQPPEKPNKNKTPCPKCHKPTYTTKEKNCMICLQPK